MKRLAALALVLAAACGGAGVSTTTSTSGIEGLVTLGPTCPVERADSPCPDRPYAAGIRIVNSDTGKAVRTVHSGSDGRFRVALSPGDYTLEPVSQGEGGLPYGKPVDVTVRPNEYVHVTVAFDSGIR
jgi:hypothetical protein